MAKQANLTTDDIKLPKYLKLAKGTMWFDNIGENCSNVSLANVNTRFIGRGYISDDDWQTYRNDGYLNKREIPEDKYGNNSLGHGEYGFVDETNDRSYFCTTDIPREKLGNIITAFNAGILVSYDPEKAQKDLPEPSMKKDFSYNKDGDLIFVGKNKHMFDKLNNGSHDDLITFIKSAPMNAKSNLMDLYDYEMQGYNRLNRPRATILDAIRSKLNEFGPGMSAITVEKD